MYVSFQFGDRGVEDNCPDEEERKIEAAIALLLEDEFPAWQFIPSADEKKPRMSFRLLNKDVSWFLVPWAFAPSGKEILMERIPTEGGPAFESLQGRFPKCNEWQKIVLEALDANWLNDQKKLQVEQQLYWDVPLGDGSAVSFKTVPPQKNWKRAELTLDLSRSHCCFLARRGFRIIASSEDDDIVILSSRARSASEEQGLCRISLSHWRLAPLGESPEPLEKGRHSSLIASLTPIRVYWMPGESQRQIDPCDTYISVTPH